MFLGILPININLMFVYLDLIRLKASLSQVNMMSLIEIPRGGDLWSETSVGHVRQHFVDGGLGDFLKANVSLVAGFFDKTLYSAANIMDTISFLSLDVDLYDSYKICMQNFGPRVSGLILYDE
jgi:hypothetical protein